MTLIVGLMRMCVVVLIAWILILTFLGRIAVGDDNPFDFFGYFTNQTSLLASIILAATGALGIAGQSVPAWFTSARGIAVSCLIIVAVIYNVLVPGTGTVPHLFSYIPPGSFARLSWLVALCGELSAHAAFFCVVRHWRRAVISGPAGFIRWPLLAIHPIYTSSV